MTREQILKKAIEKAIDNGYNIKEHWGYNESFWDNKDDLERQLFARQLIKKDYTGFEHIIFSHDFAHCFFGDEKIRTDLFYKWYDDTGFVASNDVIYEWQYHLQMMVVSDDPILYLEKFLEK